MNKNSKSQSKLITSPKSTQKSQAQSEAGQTSVKNDSRRKSLSKKVKSNDIQIQKSKDINLKQAFKTESEVNGKHKDEENHIINVICKDILEIENQIQNSEQNDKAILKDLQKQTQNQQDIDALNYHYDVNADESESPMFCDLRLKDKNDFTNALPQNDQIQIKTQQVKQNKENKSPYQDQQSEQFQYGEKQLKALKQVSNMTFKTSKTILNKLGNYNFPQAESQINQDNIFLMSVESLVPKSRFKKQEIVSAYKTLQKEKFNMNMNENISLDLKNTDNEKDPQIFTGRTATVENSTNQYKLSGRVTKQGKKSLNLNQKNLHEEFNNIQMGNKESYGSIEQQKQSQFYKMENQSTGSFNTQIQKTQRTSFQGGAQNNYSEAVNRQSNFSINTKEDLIFVDFQCFDSKIFNQNVSQLTQQIEEISDNNQLQVILLKLWDLGKYLKLNNQLQKCQNQSQKSDKIIYEQKIEYLNNKFQNVENIPLRVINEKQCHTLLSKIAIGIYIVLESSLCLNSKLMDLEKLSNITVDQDEIEFKYFKFLVIAMFGVNILNICIFDVDTILRQVYQILFISDDSINQILSYGDIQLNKTQKFTKVTDEDLANLCVKQDPNLQDWEKRLKFKNDIISKFQIASYHQLFQKIGEFKFYSLSKSQKTEAQNQLLKIMKKIFFKANFNEDDNKKTEKSQTKNLDKVQSKRQKYVVQQKESSIDENRNQNNKQSVVQISKILEKKQSSQINQILSKNKSKQLLKSASNLNQQPQNIASQNSIVQEKNLETEKLIVPKIKSVVQNFNFQDKLKKYDAKKLLKLDENQSSQKKLYQQTNESPIFQKTGQNFNKLMNVQQIETSENKRSASRVKSASQTKQYNISQTNIRDPGTRGLFSAAQPHRLKNKQMVISRLQSSLSKEYETKSNTKSNFQQISNLNANNFTRVVSAQRKKKLGLQLNNYKHAKINNKINNYNYGLDNQTVILSRDLNQIQFKSLTFNQQNAYTNQKIFEKQIGIQQDIYNKDVGLELIKNLANIQPQQKQLKNNSIMQNIIPIKQRMKKKVDFLQQHAVQTNKNIIKQALNEIKKDLSNQGNFELQPDLINESKSKFKKLAEDLKLGLVFKDQQCTHRPLHSQQELQDFLVESNQSNYKQKIQMVSFRQRTDLQNQNLFQTQLKSNQDKNIKLVNYYVKDYLTTKQNKYEDNIIYQNSTINNRETKQFIDRINSAEFIREQKQDIPRFGIMGRQTDILLKVKNIRYGGSGITLSPSDQQTNQRQYSQHRLLKSSYGTNSQFLDNNNKNKNKQAILKAWNEYSEKQNFTPINYQFDKTDANSSGIVKQQMESKFTQNIVFVQDQKS